MNLNKSIKEFKSVIPAINQKYRPYAEQVINLFQDRKIEKRKEAEKLLDQLSSRGKGPQSAIKKITVGCMIFQWWNTLRKSKMIICIWEHKLLLTIFLLYSNIHVQQILNAKPSLVNCIPLDEPLLVSIFKRVRWKCQFGRRLEVLD